MQTSSDRNKQTEASPNSTDRPHEDATSGAATELERHYSEHARPAASSAGPAARDAAHIGEQVQSAVSGGIETARDLVGRAGEQAGSLVAEAAKTAQDLAHRAGEEASSAGAKAGETARDLANRARESVAPASQAIYDQGARAGQYVTRNIHEYPATALLIAAVVGYGLAYLVHGGGRSLR